MNVRNVLDCPDFNEFKTENGIEAKADMFVAEEWRGRLWLGVVVRNGLFWWTPWEGKFSEVLETEVKQALTRNMPNPQLTHDFAAWANEHAPHGGLRVTFHIQPVERVRVDAPDGAFVWLI